MQALRLAAGLLVWTSVALLISSAAMAGGKGDPARIVSEGVILINMPGGVTRAEMSGGGFFSGDPPVASLDGAIVLTVVEASERMLVVDIPAGAPDGDYSQIVSTGQAKKQTNEDLP